MSDDPFIQPILAVPEGPPEYPANSSGAQLSPKRSIVKRAIDKTTDKFQSRAQLSQSQPSLPSSQGNRRVFSLTRAKSKERQLNEDEPATSQSSSLSPTHPPSFLRRLSSGGKQIQVTPATPQLEDESPFITPRSPPFGPTKSMFNIFRGDGSMRAGTQTLIQALQAMPWSEEPDEDNEVPMGDPESDEEEKPSNWLASSIHTIYRPLARSRLKERISSSSKGKQKKVPAEPEPIQESPVLSDEDCEEDFEPSNSQSIEERSINRKSLRNILPPLQEVDAMSSSIVRDPVRQGSMGTVKLQRRARLADKLRDIFDLDGIDQVVAEMPCWLLRSVLLQGYMYLTDSYMCFFAHLPSREDQVLKSGSLNKRSQHTKRWNKRWFVLKNDALSWYQSSADPYFPFGVLDLRYAILCDPVGDKDFRLRTNQKSIRVSADSVPSRDEWVKAIRKVMFKAQNMGDNVKIAIPYSAIVDVDRSSAMDFSETIEVKVVDRGDTYSVDSYFFAYFQDIPQALEQIRDAVRASRDIPGSSSPLPVIDTTATRSPTLQEQVAERLSPSQPAAAAKSATSIFKLASLLRPIQESLPIARSSSAPERLEPTEEFTHILKKEGSSFVPIVSSPTSSPSLLPATQTIEETSPLSPSPSLAPTGSSLSTHTYPPSTVTTPSTSVIGHPSRDTSAWGVGVPAWLKMQGRRLTNPFGYSSSTQRPSVEHAATVPASISEVISSNLPSTPKPGEYGYFSILDAPEAVIDPEIDEKFHTSFAFDEKEKLLGHFTGYIFRLLPVYGRLFISNNYFAFKSQGPLAAKTRMVLPLRDVLSTEPCKAFRFGHHGLVVIVRGHEELFFEFSDEERRAAFVRLLEKQTDEIRAKINSGDAQQLTGNQDALILEEFRPTVTSSSDSPVDADLNDLSESLPAVMFTSRSSTFLTFKPKESLHFTFLTIGSRGDVQPYISLAKGLMADGHRCRIATHGEFKDWIESHGIEYGYVGGDPAELMRICVENGMFTISFMRETMAKFRGWLDDLLLTSWKACQGTDVLVESPSAMGGYHIAEALAIPYFRAFTMTWSRTRAYPHAFAVPEHKMGGNYNYMSYVLFDQVFWRATAGQINRWRRNHLSLGSTSIDKMEPHKIPFLYNFSPTIVPPPLDWPEWIRVTGYWFLDDADVGAKKWAPPPGLLEFIDSAHQAGKKVVYIGFGSIVVSDPRAMTRTVIDAIVQSGVCAILSKGWSDRLVKANTNDPPESSDPLPSQIFPITSIPHDWLFKRIDAACHHGGAGTTGASLRAGIPTIIKPFFGDQFFWADRVEALGIGSGVRKLTVDTLSDALIAATTDQKQIDRARLVGENIRSENGVATAVEAIYRDLDYARSLIKRAGDHEHDSSESAPKEKRRSFSPRRRSKRSDPSPPSSPRSVKSEARGPASDWSVISDQEDSNNP